MQKLSKEERETHAYYNLEGRQWRVWTEIPAHERKLAKLGWKRDEKTREWVGTGRSLTFRSLLQNPASGNVKTQKKRHPGKGAHLFKKGVKRASRASR